MVIANIASDQVLAERYSRRKVGLWAVSRQKFRLWDDKYTEVTRLCKALTNWRTIHSSVFACDRKQYVSYQSVLYAKKQNRRVFLRQYRENKGQRLKKRGKHVYTGADLFQRSKRRYCLQRKWYCRKSSDNTECYVLLRGGEVEYF